MNLEELRGLLSAEGIECADGYLKALLAEFDDGAHEGKGINLLELERLLEFVGGSNRRGVN
eukprot:SAG11_NODE_5036_length_1683_cov_3.579686_2_plen_61_part_00